MNTNNGVKWRRFVVPKKVERKTEYNDVKGMKEESGGKKVDQF